MLYIYFFVYSNRLKVISEVIYYLKNVFKNICQHNNEYSSTRKHKVNQYP